MPALLPANPSHVSPAPLPLPVSLAICSLGCWAGNYCLIVLATAPDLSYSLGYSACHPVFWLYCPETISQFFVCGRTRKYIFDLIWFICRVFAHRVGKIPSRGMRDDAKTWNRSCLPSSAALNETSLQLYCTSALLLVDILYFSFMLRLRQFISRPEV